MSAGFPPKKRKHAIPVDASSSKKKSRKEAGLKEGRKGKKKGKGRAESTKEFTVVSASLVVSIPPIFAANPRAGVEEMLDSMVMRYIPAFRGVVLAHSNLRSLDANAAIKGDCPFSVCNVGFDATVWSPDVAMKLVGRVNLCSPDHISLLVHRTFNVSIPRYHIPEDTWQFEYGPAENDPEFGPEAAQTEEVVESSEMEERHETDGGGKWIHKVTGKILGGTDGVLEFTVVGLTVANEMLSLLGSIQVDPFSQEHVPQSGSSTKAPSEDPRGAQSWSGGPDIDMDVDGENEEHDTFRDLGKLGDEATAMEEVRMELQLEIEKKERKRRRKSEDEAGQKKKEKKEKKEKKTG